LSARNRAITELQRSGCAASKYSIHSSSRHEAKRYASVDSKRPSTCELVKTIQWDDGGMTESGSGSSRKKTLLPVKTWARCRNAVVLPEPTGPVRRSVPRLRRARRSWSASSKSSDSPVSGESIRGRTAARVGTIIFDFTRGAGLEMGLYLEKRGSSTVSNVSSPPPQNLPSLTSSLPIFCRNFTTTSGVTDSFSGSGTSPFSLPSSATLFKPARGFAPSRASAPSW
jgi:hypothetical protein